MKKSQKWLLAVLCVVLCLCVLSACVVDDHTHSYTEVGFDETNHWKYCKQDNVKDDSSVKAHEYTETGSDETNHWKYCKVDNVKDAATVEAHKDENRDGKCDVCGHAVKVPAPIVKYGTLRGTVSLNKLGATTASGDGVTVKVVDSDGEVDVKDFTLDQATGVYTMQCPVGEYTLKISKDGYDAAEYDIEITENDTVTMDVTLAYKVFMAAPKPGWDWNLVDTTHVNDRTPYFVVNNEGGGKTLDMVTCEAYQDGIFTLKVKRGYSANGDDRVGPMAYFYNSDLDRYEFAWFSSKGGHKDDQGNYVSGSNLVEWVGMDLWDQIYTVKNGYWGFNGSNLTEEEIAQFDEGTLEIGIARHENMIFALVNGQIRDTLILDEKYANYEMRFGALGYDVSSGNNKWYFNLDSDISSLLEGIDSHDVDIEEVEHVTITPNRTKVYNGQGVVLTVTPDEGYEVISLMVGDKDVAAQISNGKVVLNGYSGEKITAKVVSTSAIDVEIAVEGLDGYTVTFIKGDVQHPITVEDGKATFNGSAGIWQAVVNYMGKDFDLGNIVVNAQGKGTLSGLIDIFDPACMAGWGDTVSSKHNVTTNSGTITTSGTMFHRTLTSYDEVAITMYAGNQSTEEYIGLTMSFDNEYIWLALWVNKENNCSYSSIQWVSGSWFEGAGTPCKNIGDRTWNGFGKGDSWKVVDSDGNVLFQNATGLTEEELALFNESKLPVTLVRKGANVYAFVNGRYIGMRNVGDEIGARKVKVGLSNFGKKGDGQLSYKIETNISAYTAICEGDSTFKYVVNGDHIVVTGNKDGYKVNDFAEITLEVETGYTITSFKVNGQTVEPTMSFKKWILDKNLADVTIDIETAEYHPVDIEYTVKGVKHGYANSEVNLPNGKVKLENAIFQYELDLVDGKLVGKQIATGIYTLTYDGYKSTTVTVDEEDLNKQITLEHINFESGNMFWNDQAEEGYTDGKAWLALKDGQNTLTHQTTELFDNVAITLYADSTQSNEHMGVFVKFGSQFIWYNIKKDGTLEWNCQTWMKGPIEIVNITGTMWNGFGPNEWWFCNSAGGTMYQGGADLTDDEKTMFANGTLPLTLVRKGTNLYAFINGKYIGMRSVGDEIGAGQVTVGLTNFGAVANAKLSYLIETDISAYLAKCEGQSTFKYEIQGEHYTVEGNTEGYNVNDFAEITITAQDGYVILSAKVDGNSVNPSSLTFKRWVLATNLANVKIELEVAKIENVTAEITAEGMDGLEVTIIKGDTQLTATVQNGKVKFDESVEVGIWTAKAEYMGAEIELGNVVIHADGSGEINHIANIFDQTSIANNWGDKVDNQHDITTNTGKVFGSGVILHKTRTSYDDVALTLYANKNATNEYIGLTMNFDNDYLWLALWVDDNNNFSNIQWVGGSWFQGDNPGNNNITDSTWNHFGNGDSWKVYDVDGNVIYQNGSGLTAEELTMLGEGTLPITLVRSGANVYLFINGRYVGMRNVGDEIGARKVNVGLTNFGKKGNGELSYKIETDITEYLAKCEGDSTFKYVVSGDHIIVTGNKEGYKVNDFAEISIAAEEGYTITSVKVDGVETEERSFKKWLLGKDIADVKIEVTTVANE